MHKLLEKAFNKASRLPDEEKDAFAAFILEELENEKKWSRLYKASPKFLENMAKEALTEYKEGKTKKLDINKL